MIKWHLIPREYKYLSIDSDNICRLSEDEPFFNKKGQAKFKWNGLEERSNVQHKQVLAKYIKKLNIDQIMAYYTSGDVVSRDNIFSQSYRG